LLSPLFTIPDPVFETLFLKVVTPFVTGIVILPSRSFSLGVLPLSPIFELELDCIENPVLEKSATLDFNIAVGLSFVSEPISSEGFGRVIFFRELGRWLISGKNDSPVF